MNHPDISPNDSKWKNCFKTVLLPIVAMLLLSLKNLPSKPVIVTYVTGYNGKLIQPETIHAEKLTHILYAFADIKNNKLWLRLPRTDTANLKRLNLLRRKNLSIKILLSVGGLGWSKNFSDMALQESSRKTFALSCTRMCKKYNLDGIDIDWEFPGYAGEGGNIYRPEDKQNYTSMFKTLRETFNELEQQTGKQYELTTAVDGWAPHFLPHTQMGEVQKYVDYILLMTYNFNTKDAVGGTFLYSPKNWNPLGSVDGAVTEFAKAGVQASKLVVGMGFFPAAFNMATANPNDRKYLSKTKIPGGLANVYNNFINKNGFTRYWVDEAKAPYLFNETGRKRISYEDQESVKAKCDYVKEKQLAGVMYWQYYSDPKRQLLNTVFTALK